VAIGEPSPRLEIGLAQAVAADRREKPLVEIEGGHGRLTWSSLRELSQFRDVLEAFVARSIKARYKQATIGAGWAILQPLLAAALFALFLGRYARLSSGGQPYLLFALAGMTAWTFFSGATSTASESLVVNQSLLRKVYFPRELLPVSSVGASLVDLGIGSAVLIVATFAYGRTPSVTWIAFPVPLLIVVLTAAAIGLTLSSLNVYYRDVRYALPFLLQIGLFATPVVYDLSEIPSGWRRLYGILNPVAGSIDGIRRTVLAGKWPDAVVTLGALGWAVLLLLAGLALFKRLERGFSDRV
jgi:homopolymeric O-antigen transport system permease protein